MSEAGPRASASRDRQVQGQGGEVEWQIGWEIWGLWLVGGEVHAWEVPVKLQMGPGQFEAFEWEG